MAERIEVHEVGLRDGLQNIKTVVPTDLVDFDAFGHGPVS